MRHTRRVAVLALSAFALWHVALAGASWALARASERAHPPIGRLLDVDGRRVHLVDHGAPPGRPDAPAIVLLHGASTSLLDMEASLAPALAGRFRVITVDRPGHGYSERGDAWPDPYAQAAAIRGALSAIGVERAVWVGHSWAGSVVLAALLEEPAHARAGVLLAGATHPWEGGSAWHAELAARPALGRAFAWTYVEPAGRALLDEAIASVFAPETVPPGYVERTGVTLSLRPATYRANAVDLTRLSEHLARQSARYPGIDRPLLSITGTADDVVPARNHDARLARQLPALRSVALEGAGHAFPHTRTERVAALIGGFVDALASDDGVRSTASPRLPSGSTAARVPPPPGETP